MNPLKPKPTDNKREPPHSNIIIIQSQVSFFSSVTVELEVGIEGDWVLQFRYACQKIF